MKAPTNSPSLADFWDDGSSPKYSKVAPGRKNDDSSASDLLNWISNATIKRRAFRRRSRCSNLRAEAILNSALRKARQELAERQEEKRQKAQEFSYKISFKISQINDNTKHQALDEENYYCFENDQGSIDSSYNLNVEETNKNINDCRGDEHVQACISSLDNFFSELKSIKA